MQVGVYGEASGEVGHWGQGCRMRLAYTPILLKMMRFLHRDTAMSPCSGCPCVR